MLTIIKLIQINRLQMKVKDPAKAFSMDQHFLAYSQQPVYVISRAEQNEKEKESAAQQMLENTHTSDTIVGA